MGPTQPDRGPYKERGHRQAQRTQGGHREETAACTPRREAPRGTNAAGTLTLDVWLPNHEKIISVVSASWAAVLCCGGRADSHGCAPETGQPVCGYLGPLAAGKPSSGSECPPTCPLGFPWQNTADQGARQQMLASHSSEGPESKSRCQRISSGEDSPLACRRPPSHCVHEDANAIVGFHPMAELLPKSPTS